MILSEHLVRCDTDNKEFDNYWYRWTIGRLQQVFLTVSIGISQQKLNRNYLFRLSYCTCILFVAAPRTSAKVQRHLGNAAVHPRFGSAYFRRVPPVRCIVRIRIKLFDLKNFLPSSISLPYTYATLKTQNRIEAPRLGSLADDLLTLSLCQRY
ncbi:unnamed protein product [Nesidiocoris tenuis]|uniref:MIF4G-like type 2 domain-containing protein n=1 Tax=Nesidiocoris tenuis TaxID=355587 RepID=A0A6H5GVM6_9HEMI|nr:unnamed protein product [Nesidiocoris tenuis]